MLIERRFFIWDEGDNNLPVKLGERIDSLLNRKIIVAKDQKENEFRLAQNEHIWIGSKNNLVSYIYLTRNAGNELLRIDPFEFKYPATEPISRFLQNKYDQLPFKSLDEVNKNFSGDLIYLLFKDFIPSKIFLIRLKTVKQ